MIPVPHLTVIARHGEGLSFFTRVGMHFVTLRVTLWSISTVAMQHFHFVTGPTCIQ